MLADAQATPIAPPAELASGSARSASFVAFPEETLLEAGKLPIRSLAELACREGQCTGALYRVHRWFARRLGSQFRGILAALRLGADQEDHFWAAYNGDLNLRGAVVLDAFVGGGTSVVEASRCGARVIGYDIDPVATFITRFELSAASYSRLPPTARALTASIRASIAPLHRTAAEDGAEADVLHHFWVEVMHCGGCGAEIEIHPRHQLAYNAAKRRQWAFCRACHAVHELPISAETLSCECGTDTPILTAPLQKGTVRCSCCGHAAPLAARGTATGQPPQWRLFAQEYLVREGRRLHRRFKAATQADRERYETAARLLEEAEQHGGRFAPERNIPADGRFDARPIIHGISRYRGLFNARQLLHLTLLGRAITGVPEEAARRLLALAFSEHLTTNCMYAGYAFGYRRLSPLFSIHAYRHITRPVELNPWIEGAGRGTFPNVLRKIERAIQHARTPSVVTEGGRKTWNVTPVGPARGGVSDDPAAVVRGEVDAAIRTQSSVDLTVLPDESVDLILTDPPYLDNISYSELSDFYLAWHQVLGVAEAPYGGPDGAAPIQENLAARRRGDVAVRKYRTELTAILRECARVLRPDGVCVFTYHHLSPKAWWAVAHALAASGLRCTAVVPLRGEGQGGLHTHSGTIKWDAVLVCRKRMERVETGGELLVPRSGVLRAARRTRAYAGGLAIDPRVGFEEPDQLNLYRALLASEAFFGCDTKRAVPLEAALRRVPRRALWTRKTASRATATAVP